MRSEGRFELPRVSVKKGLRLTSPVKGDVTCSLCLGVDYKCVEVKTCQNKRAY